MNVRRAAAVLLLGAAAGFIKEVRSAYNRPDPKPLDCEPGCPCRCGQMSCGCHHRKGH